MLMDVGGKNMTDPNNQRTNYATEQKQMTTYPIFERVQK